MGLRHFMTVLAAALLSAIVAMLLFIVPTLAQIEEAWSITVVAEVLAVARVTLIVALAHAIMFGLPLFLLLRSINGVGLLSCALGGFLVGALPFGALDLSPMFGVQSASTGGEATVVNGVPTPAGWFEFARAVGLMGSLGLAGGLTFWAALRVSGPGVDVPGEAAVRTSPAASWSVVSIALVLTLSVLLLPRVVRDNSCHNLFRDGRTAIGPQISANMKLTAEDWPKLTQIFADFAAAHALSFRSDQKVRQGNIMWRDLNLCNEAGVNIDAVDRPWLAHVSLLADRGINFSVYEMSSGSDWNRLARDLLAQIDTTWPDKTTFRGPDGKVVSKAEALGGRR